MPNKTFNMAKNDWKTIIIEKAIVERIKLALMTDVLLDQNIKSMSQFVKMSITEKLDRLGIGTINVSTIKSDHMRIIDRNVDGLGKIFSVYYNRTGKPWCEHCKKTDCVHIQYAQETPVFKIMSKTT